MTKLQLERRNDYLLLQLKIISQITEEAINSGTKEGLAEAIGAISHYSAPETVKHNIQFIEEYDEKYNFYNPTMNNNEYK